MDSLEAIRQAARQFVDDRSWDEYQSPKNLSMAMIVEAGELVEHFQWMESTASRNPDAATVREIAAELADVLVYLVRIADELDIDLAAETLSKIRRNADKYPLSTSVKGPLRIKPEDI
ncbi:MAG: NTP pyrophosphohydrolase [marine bacterium B5-7]|nr:MAG: NTP pyrophosphohydrolase [marine bacterium B5-7]